MRVLRFVGGQEFLNIYLNIFDQLIFLSKMNF